MTEHKFRVGDKVLCRTGTTPRTVVAVFPKQPDGNDFVYAGDNYTWLGNSIDWKKAPEPQFEVGKFYVPARSPITVVYEVIAIRDNIIFYALYDNGKVQHRSAFDRPEARKHYLEVGNKYGEPTYNG